MSIRVRINYIFILNWNNVQQFIYVKMQWKIVINHRINEINL